jgi:hypothetical protein
MRYIFAPFGFLLSLLVGLGGWFVGSMTCDDGCTAEPAHWTDDKDAAEWGNMVLYSGGVVLAACVFLGAVIAAARGVAIGALLLQGVFVFALLRLATALNHVDGEEILFAVAPLVLGVATLAGLQLDLSRRDAS